MEKIFIDWLIIPAKLRSLKLRLQMVWDWQLKWNCETGTSYIKEAIDNDK